MEENEELLESTNEIVEITDEGEEKVYEEEVPTREEVKSKKSKNKKDKKKLPKWSDLSKKGKIIVISCATLLVLLIVGLVLFFCLRKDKKEEVPKEEEVILDKGNYRYENGKLVFLDSNKNELGTYECEHKNENNCYLASYSGEDDFDTVKRVYEEDNKGIKEPSDIFAKQFVFVYDSDKEEDNIILYDLVNGKTIDKYLLVKKYDDENVIVENSEEKYGLLNIKDEVKTKIDFKYDYLGKVLEKVALVAKVKNNSLLLDLDGKELSKNISGDIKNYTDKYISILVKDEYKLYDYEGKEAFKDSYDYITFKDNYVFVISKKKLYAYDSNLNMLNGKGIDIESNIYNKTIYYDKDLKETKREDAFTIEVGSSSIVISEGDKKSEINIYEGKLNSNYKYVSYSDGVLYIYKDEAKTNLLGSYTCKNKNNIIKDSNEFDNCFIARETKLLNNSNSSKELGYLPIINNRYVFISDTSSAKDSNAILYDLKDNKNLVSYQQADAGYYKKDIGYVNSAALYVMAKNSDGYFGIIKVEVSSVNRIVAFTGTTEIKYLNNDFLVKKENKYYLYNTKGEIVASSDNEIVELGKSGLLVKDGNNYRVIAIDGSKIYKAGLKYVKLYDGYFIGVDANNSEVNVYKYVENSKGCIKLGDGQSLPKVDKDFDKILVAGNTIIVGSATYEFNLGEMYED